MKRLLLLLVIVTSCSCFALRNIFELQEKNTNVSALHVLPLKEFLFLGVVIGKQTLALLGDHHDNSYCILRGQEVGLEQAKVIQILNDKIILLLNKRFVVLN